MWDEELYNMLMTAYAGKKLRAGTDIVEEGENIDEINDDFVVTDIYRDYNEPDSGIDEDNESWNWSVSHVVTMCVENGVVIDFQIENGIYGDDGLGDYDPSEVFDSEEYFDTPMEEVEKLVEG